MVETAARVSTDAVALAADYKLTYLGMLQLVVALLDILVRLYQTPSQLIHTRLGSVELPALQVLKAVMVELADLESS
jgi:hypothetical protein